MTQLWIYDIVTIQGYYPLRGGGDSAFLCHGWHFSCSFSISLCIASLQHSNQGYSGLLPTKGQTGLSLIFLCWYSNTERRGLIVDSALLTTVSVLGVLLNEEAQEDDVATSLQVGSVTPPTTVLGLL